ncbi:MAG: ATP-binding protein [[Ruminococcus] lactaris]|nr:ATP-binding protein [[Ruminococcus] lactaris]
MYNKVLGGALHGVEGRLITVEADVSEGLPTFNMVGFLASEVREASDRVRTALRNAGYLVPPKKITVNLSPADVRKEGSAFDLPISIALLTAYGYIPEEYTRDILMIGELSLNGDVCGVRGILPIVDYAKSQGIHKVILPYQNRREAGVIPDMEIVAVRDLKQTVEYLLGDLTIPTELPLQQDGHRSLPFAEDFADVKGQKLLKRATEIAVAGMHNILYLGPPGAGKSMIAKRIPTIMPGLSYEESLELTKIYSVNGMLDAEEGLVWNRPFRMPHHSITANALIGGGKIPKPGEISLAHQGVLFLDELPEFKKGVLEVLRQPLEQHCIRITRNYGTYTFPADFMLVAAMNPCPCGCYPNLERCTCTPAQIQAYLGKISQPFLDRIDLCVEAGRVDYENLTEQKKGEASAEIRMRVCRVRNLQKERYEGKKIRRNTQLEGELLKKYCALGTKEEAMMRQAFERFSLTARSYHRILRVARTIADLDGREKISEEHLSEALGYRMVDKKYWGR